MADEPARSVDHDPSATADGIILVVPLPGELGAGRTVSCAVADVQEVQRAEGNFPVGHTLEGEMRLLDKIEEVAVPVAHFDDTPASGKGLGEAGHLGHQPAPATSLGSRTRL